MGNAHTFFCVDGHDRLPDPVPPVDDFNPRVDVQNRGKRPAADIFPVSGVIQDSSDYVFCRALGGVAVFGLREG